MYGTNESPSIGQQSTNFGGSHLLKKRAAVDSTEMRPENIFFFLKLKNLTLCKCSLLTYSAYGWCSQPWWSSLCFALGLIQKCWEDYQCPRSFQTFFPKSKSVVNRLPWFVASCPTCCQPIWPSSIWLLLESATSFPTFPLTTANTNDRLQRSKKLMYLKVT